MRRDQPSAFFDQRDLSGALLKNRNHWLDTSPELCLANATNGDQLVSDVWNLAEQWGHVEPQADRSLENLGRQWEADFILLNSADFKMAGGCVCFPSSWNLQESTGKSLGEVHGTVPLLTEQIGDKIDRFLHKIPDGQAFLRRNWGLTRSPHLNYHPALKRPQMDVTVTMSDVYLRIEHQAFVRLPSGVLLGVRIEPVNLKQVIEEAPQTARRLRVQLKTMPDEVAIYKGLDQAIPRIVELLDQNLDGNPA